MTKDEVNAAARQKRRENPEHYREIERRYRARHPERQKGKKTRWRRDNVERARAIEKIRRDKNIEHFRAKKRASYARHKHEFDDRSRRTAAYRQKYNLTLEAYAALFQQQDGRCASCLGPSGTRRLHVDHDHQTKQIRGLLCHGCNAALGFLRDDVTRIEALASYLRHAIASGLTQPGGVPSEAE